MLFAIGSDGAAACFRMTLYCYLAIIVRRGSVPEYDLQNLRGLRRCWIAGTLKIVSSSANKILTGVLCAIKEIRDIITLPLNLAASSLILAFN